MNEDLNPNRTPPSRAPLDMNGMTSTTTTDQVTKPTLAMGWPITWH